MSKNIVILSGSPRKDGNTDLLVDAFVKGTKDPAMPPSSFAWRI